MSASERVLSVALLAICLTPCGLFAQGPNPKVVKAQKNCQGENIPDSPARLTIDANSGQVTGNTRYPAGTAIQVVLVHKNPFKYQYRADITSAPLDQAIIGDFFKSVLDALTPGPALAAAPAAAPAVPGAPVCTSLDDALAQVSKTQKALDVLLPTRVDAYAAYQAFLTATDTDSLNCPDVCSAAAALLPQLDTLTAADFAAAGKAFVDAVSNLQTEIAKANALCPSLPDAQKNIAAWQKKAKQVDELIQAKASFDKMRTLVNKVFASEYPFEQPYFPPIPSSAALVSIKAFRVNLRSPDAAEELVVSTTVQVGQSRVSVSMGIAATNAPDIAIGRVPANVVGDDGKTTLGNRFGYLSNTTKARPVILTMLNGLLDQRAGWGRVIPSAISTGFAFRIEGSNKGQIEWVPFALGWDLHNDQVLLTFGWHLSRIDTLDQKLPEGVDDTGQFFKIGDVVPASLTDPLQLGRTWGSGVVLGLTFRMK